MSRTRHVNARYKSHKVPLPQRDNMIVERERARPTSTNPNCHTSQPQYGIAQELSKHTVWWFCHGEGLSLVPCTYQVTFATLRNNVGIGYTDDIFYALGWKLAATKKGLTVTIEEIQ